MLPRAERLTTREFAHAFANGRALRHRLMQVRVCKRDAKKSETESGERDENVTLNQNVEAATRDKTATRKVAVKTTKVEGARAAFVVAKKIGKANVRNGLRRRVREMYRLHTAREKLRARSFDLIFLLSPNALQASPEELKVALDDLLRRVLRV